MRMILLLGRHSVFRAASLAILLFFQLRSSATTLAEPVPSVYASYRGAFTVRVEPGEVKDGKSVRKATARVFKYSGRNKSYTETAFFDLENQTLPGKLLISDDGSHIVGVDDWGDNGYKRPVIIVYNGAGKVLKRFHLGDFLTKAEIEELKPRDNLPYWQTWAIQVRLWDDPGAILVIRDEVISGPGKKHDNLRIDLKDFRIWKDIFNGLLDEK